MQLTEDEKKRLLKKKRDVRKAQKDVQEAQRQRQQAEGKMVGYFEDLCRERDLDPEKHKLDQSQTAIIPDE